MSEPVKLSVLLSFAYLRRAPELLDACPPEWDLLLDSGAFTNFTSGRDVVTLEDYRAFCLEHAGRFAHVVNLDVIGDPVASAANFEQLVDAGVAPVPVFQRGDTAAALRKMAADHPLVCIGGISQYLGSAAEQAYIRETMRHVRAAGARVHLLGVGHRELSTYRPWSGDSSTWHNAVRYGHFRLWHAGKRWRFSKLHRDVAHKDYVRPDPERTRVLAAYGLRWADLATRSAWADEGEAACLNVAGWVRFARHLRRHGTRYVFAVAPPHLPLLNKVWARERGRWGWT